MKCRPAIQNTDATSQRPSSSTTSWRQSGRRAISVRMGPAGSLSRDKNLLFTPLAIFHTRARLLIRQALEDSTPPFGGKNQRLARAIALYSHPQDKQV